MKVLLRNPKRTVEIAGPMRVSKVLDHLSVNPESVIVIRADELVTGDVEIADEDEIELRPVISGG
ncbi:MAG: MoaD/ThiS family protein [Acidimicrobiia bacterium]|nr:MoaD/ThiS family protein [Acidimicrobiia bacterium]